MYEIRIYEGNYEKRHSYRTTWGLVKLTAMHVGEMWKRAIVDVYYNGNHFCTMFTGYGM